MGVHILGIRHHGVGSAKKVAERLQELKPDFILVEGPPEISSLLTEIGNPDLVPPVAIMVFNNKEPKQSTFYPFTSFSPEWIAAQYANEHKIPLRALDLPACISFKKESEPESSNEIETQVHFRDPLSYLSEISGFDSGETWWENFFENESSTPAAEHFEATNLAMESLRNADIPSFLDQENIDREAYMRQIIQEVKNEMYSNIAVICGAWHAPSLIDLDAQNSNDQKILKKLPKSKIEIATAWIPWTNSRLSIYSGYGAGLRSPGWYEHQWNSRENTSLAWLAKVANAFRNEGIDISTAHVMETYRLAEALCALRNKSTIQLEDLNEAIYTVMCMGDSILFELIKKQIIVGEKIGSIPEHLPKVPLQRDFDERLKSLRLQLSAMPKQYDLDLRKPLDLERSIFFHRIELLDFKWAQRTHSRTKGTFKESWVLQWEPIMQIAIVDKAFYGNTIESACTGFVAKKSSDTTLISELMALVEFCIPAELYESIEFLLQKINDESAISNDTRDLMLALPKLIEIIKYGNVRNSDISHLQTIADRLLTKVFITLPSACYGLDEDNSNAMFELIRNLNSSILILENTEIQEEWYKTLELVISKSNIHFVIIGCTIRLLFDGNRLSEEKSNQLFAFYLSNGNAANDVAYWIEGFLRGNGLILIYDDKIWNLIYDWISKVEKNEFMELLPVLRRAFSKFPYSERRQIGEKAKSGIVTFSSPSTSLSDQLFDRNRAASILPFISTLLQS